MRYSRTVTTFIRANEYEQAVVDDQSRLKTIDDFMLNSEVPLDLDDLMLVLAEAYKVPIALIGIVGEFSEQLKLDMEQVFPK